jgi:hypothetical protein
VWVDSRTAKGEAGLAGGGSSSFIAEGAAAVASSAAFGEGEAPAEPASSSARGSAGASPSQTCRGGGGGGGTGGAGGGGVTAGGGAGGVAGTVTERPQWGQVDVRLAPAGSTGNRPVQYGHTSSTLCIAAGPRFV